MNTATARNALITAPDPTAPEWIELIPAGPLVVGVDGRQWINDAPDRIVAKANEARNPIVVDYEHASELRAPQGLDAPAAGWIDRLEVRGAGSIWGHVEWTAKALQDIVEKAYRFLSPVFTFEKDTARIVELVSAGLTNKPNLPLTALNQRGSPRPIMTPDQQEIARQFGMSDEAFYRATQAELHTAQNAARIAQHMTLQQRQICQAMGLSPDDYIKTDPNL